MEQRYIWTPVRTGAFSFGSADRLSITNSGGVAYELYPAFRQPIARHPFSVAYVTPPSCMRFRAHGACGWQSRGMKYSSRRIVGDSGKWTHRSHIYRKRHIGIGGFLCYTYLGHRIGSDEFLLNHRNDLGQTVNSKLPHRTGDEVAETIDNLIDEGLLTLTPVGVLCWAGPRASLSTA